MGHRSDVTGDRTALVLSGGNALGAFQGGACAALHGGGIRPGWVVGVSTGAANAILIAGNPPEKRVEALHAFWSEASWPTPGWLSLLGAGGDSVRRLIGQMQTAAWGTPAMFAPNVVGSIAGEPTRIGLYDQCRLASSLEKHADFDRLNHGGIRVTIAAVDIETGDEAVFDTRTHFITPRHVLASTALIPEMQPVEIEGRLLADGGLRCNLPLDIVLREPGQAGLCVAIDLFGGAGPRPASFGELALRRQELMFHGQTDIVIGAHARERELRRQLRAVIDLLPESQRRSSTIAAAVEEAARPDLELLWIGWPPAHETGNRTYDFSDQAIKARWTAGEQAAEQALRARRDDRGRVAGEARREAVGG